MYGLGIYDSSFHCGYKYLVSYYIFKDLYNQMNAYTNNYICRAQLEMRIKYKVYRFLFTEEFTLGVSYYISSNKHTLYNMNK